VCQFADFNNDDYADVCGVVDFVAPSVSNIYPSNNSNIQSTSVGFMYAATDNIGISNCSLYIDGVLNETYNNNSNFTSRDLGYGSYEWYVTCIDARGNSGTSMTTLFSLSETPQTGGGGGSSGGSGGQLEIIEGGDNTSNINLPSECIATSFSDKLFSKCKIEDNGICEDGENFLIDDDCRPSLSDITDGSIFKAMWFIRAILLLGIFLLFKKDKNFPLVVILLISLLVLNGAFGYLNNESTHDEDIDASPSADVSSSEVGNRWVDYLTKQNAALGVALGVLAAWFLFSYLPNRKRGR
jgi:hypothetical protein